MSCRRHSFVVFPPPSPPLPAREYPYSMNAPWTPPPPPSEFLRWSVGRYYRHPSSTSEPPLRAQIVVPRGRTSNNYEEEPSPDVRVEIDDELSPRVPWSLDTDEYSRRRSYYWEGSESTTSLKCRLEKRKKRGSRSWR
ncbi:hypothetical protein ACHAXA_007686 [Cyclostephanos tholiformis]|uniref:Uncharacterized protein n=1 Tax=Cyclostephanos tholiformis TaxID=382380 RepID=A0ABD3SDG1_9STRA